ncbi:MAG: lysine transporter LysE [Verrucomicrobia bacterium RIFCSPLOWO2_12_FULL_64_8]|nr:MAG: lysine transporter LysE [Verrucomicrobia bacterium RIFCSPLOWO2_12_FULL_64_8]
MSNYWSEFLLVAVAHLVAVASPGPDFALVLRQSITHGRRTAVWTSVGIGSGILLHVTYSLLGIGLLVQSSTLAFNTLKGLGAAYLAWIGFHTLRAKPRAQPAGESVTGTEQAAPIPHSAFVTGFLTNALNPKATLFFVALFSVGINPRTPHLIQAGYGLWMSLATMGWFTLVSLFFSQDRVRAAFLRHGHWFERIMGVILLALAFRLAVASLR